MVGEVAAADADRVHFGYVFGRGHQRRHGSERFARIVHVEPGDDHAHAVVGEPAADVDDAGVEELRFVDAHDIHVRGHEQNVLRRIHRCRTDGVRIVRDDLLFGVAHVDAGFEDLDFLIGELGPFQAADQLLRLARKHRAAHHFDPAFAAGVFQKHKVP